MFPFPPGVQEASKFSTALPTLVIICLFYYIRPRWYEIVCYRGGGGCFLDSQTVGAGWEHRDHVAGRVHFPGEAEKGTREGTNPRAQLVEEATQARWPPKDGKV